jgi:uncharacterized protein YecE (DUF72 family)
VRVLTGTSGFSYSDWKGSFYPADIRARGMLASYASRLHSVEINNTFYRMPRADIVRGWAAQVPDDFRFVIKASRRITHMRQLVGADDVVRLLVDVARELGAKLGPLLFQLPPVLKKDAARLEAFCASLPAGVRAAFEFRDWSWYSDDIYEILRAHGAALCGGDPEEVPQAPPIVATADFGYIRMRRDDYSESEIAGWAERILSQPWTEAYVFFKHEAMGPFLALALDARCTGRRSTLAKTRGAIRKATAKAKKPDVAAARTGTVARKPKRSRRGNG